MKWNKWLGRFFPHFELPLREGKFINIIGRYAHFSRPDVLQMASAAFSHFHVAMISNFFHFSYLNLAFWPDRTRRFWAVNNFSKKKIHQTNESHRWDLMFFFPLNKKIDLIYCFTLEVWPTGSRCPVETKKKELEPSGVKRIYRRRMEGSRAPRPRWWSHFISFLKGKISTFSSWKNLDFGSGRTDLTLRKLFSVEKSSRFCWFT